MYKVKRKKRCSNAYMEFIKTKIRQRTEKEPKFCYK